MKTWNQKVGTLGAFVSVVALGLSVTQAAAAPKDVNVVNTPDVNASVVNEPTVHVGSSVDVNAFQAGEWSVNVETMAKTLKEFTGNLQSTDGWVEVYQVPSSKRFILTDIFLNQRTFGAFNNAISLNRNDSVTECGIGSTSFMQTHTTGPETSDNTQVNRQVFYPLSTGYEFVEGERICIAQSGGGLIFYNLSGYETDM